MPGEIITAFVAAIGTIATTVGLVAYLLRDLRADLGEVRSEVSDFRGEVRADIAEFRTEVRTDINELRTEVRTDIADVRTEIRQVLVELLHHVQGGHPPLPPHAA